MTAHTLVLGDRTAAGVQVHARVLASAGYCVGHQPTDEGLDAVSASLRDAARGDRATTPAMFLADADMAETPWTPISDLEVVPAASAAPEIRFQSPDGQMLPPSLRRVVEQTRKIIILADDLAWQAVVLVAGRSHL